MNIAARLLFLFVGVTILPLGLFSYFNLQQNEATLRGEVLKRLADLADKKSSQIRGYLFERREDARLLARQERTAQALDALSSAYLRYRGDSSEYARVDALFRSFFAVHMEEGLVYDVFLITPQGEVVYTQKHEADFASNLLTGVYRDTQLGKAFREASMTLEPTLSTYELYAPSHNIPAAFVAAPVIREGSFRGVLAMQLNNDRLIRVATDATGLGMSGETVLAELNGMGGVRITAPLKSDPQAAMQRSMDLKTITGTPLTYALEGNPGEGVKPDYRGNLVVAAWRYLPELDWGMVVKIDQDEVFAPIYRQHILLLETLLGLLLFTVLIAYYFGRQISVPLEGLARVAGEVAAGELGKRADESAPGEVGLFARAFNRMTEKLQALYASLEERIEERTRELNMSNEQLHEEIDEREHIEKALQQSSDYITLLLNSVVEGIYGVNKHGNCTFINAAGLRLLGYEEESELVGSHIHDMIHHTRPDGSYYPSAECRLYRCLQSGEDVHVDDELFWRKDGSSFPVDYWSRQTLQSGEAGAVVTFMDISGRKRAEEEIRNLAYFDALTGLPNRRLLLDRFHAALLLSARSHHCGALLFLDMDKFKTLNDTLGHDYGDLMLVEVGRRIQASVREVDTVARLGGDEFVVLLENISSNLKETSKKAALVAEKVRGALAQPYILKEHEFHSSPSIGVCLYRGALESVDTLMKRADMAMYQAKDSGRNAVRFFDPEMQKAVEKRAELEADLRRALPNRELQLFYQIQLDSGHRPVGAEALIRWQHPQHGMVSPIHFIPVAEESALILEVGLWVFETACQQLAAWKQSEELCHLVLAVNVSAQQFRLRDFVSSLEEIMLRYDIDPERLKLELTESVVLEDVTDVVAKMHALKALGVRLSLDDFGTGYSSLAYLKQLPLDQIKIDQSFVRDITSDPNDAVMVKAIIGMAQNFRLHVIAEGVETEAQLAFLKQNGCMAYQGYLFGKPVPLAEFEVLLRRLAG